MFRASLCSSSGEQDVCYCTAAPHNRYQPHPAEPAQHTTCSNTRLVLLKMGIIMPETCWESVDNKHLTVASCWFSLSLHNLLTMHGHRNLKHNAIICAWYNIHTTRHEELPLYHSPTGNTPTKYTLSNAQSQTTARDLHPKDRKYFPKIYFVMKEKYQMHSNNEGQMPATYCDFMQVFKCFSTQCSSSWIRN